MSERPGLRDLSGERFPTSGLVTREALIDSGLPTIVFVTVFALNSQVLGPALLGALVCGAVLAVVRLARREKLANVVAGFVAVGIAAWLANRTGRAEDYFLPGILINGAYVLAYLVSILVRWPLLGVLVGLATGEGMGWRQVPYLLRAYSLASWFWVGMFGARLAVQLPLYLSGEVVALGVARVVMGWPLFLLCLWMSWIVIRRARTAQGVAEAGVDSAGADGDADGDARTDEKPAAPS